MAHRASKTLKGNSWCFKLPCVFVESCMEHVKGKEVFVFFKQKKKLVNILEDVTTNEKEKRINLTKYTALHLFNLSAEYS